MAKVIIELDIPPSETRAIEAHYVDMALQMVAQQIRGEGMDGKHEITMPGNFPGAPRIVLGTWHYEPTAKR